MENLTNGQVDLLLTMLMAEATDTDTFEMEQELKNKGLIEQPSTIGLMKGE
jgi:hypothetical protein